MYMDHSIYIYIYVEIEILLKGEKRLSYNIYISYHYSLKLKYIYDKCKQSKIKSHCNYKFIYKRKITNFGDKDKAIYVGGLIK